LTVKAFKARFAKPVYPGQTIRTEIWKENEDKLFFRCKVKETDEPCITGGWVKLTQQESKL